MSKLRRSRSLVMPSTCQNLTRRRRFMPFSCRKDLTLTRERSLPFWARAPGFPIPRRSTSGKYRQTYLTIRKAVRKLSRWLATSIRYIRKSTIIKYRLRSRERYSSEETTKSAGCFLRIGDASLETCPSVCGLRFGSWTGRPSSSTCSPFLNCPTMRGLIW